MNEQNRHNATCWRTVRTLALAAVAAVAVACSGDADGDGGRKALTLSAVATPWQQQTLSITRSGEAETLAVGGFDLYCATLGMTPKQVSIGADGRWDYGYGKPIFWPDNKVQTDMEAYACAPHNAVSGWTPAAGPTVNVTFPPTADDNTTDADNTTDLMWAKGTVGADGVVRLDFRHALARVSFGTFANNYGSKVTVKSITVQGDLYTSRTLSLADGQWQGGTTKSKKLTRDSDPLPLDIANGNVNSNDGTPRIADLLLIPGPTVTVTVKITTADGKDADIVFPVELEAGVHQQVNITLGLNHEVVIE